MCLIRKSRTRHSFGQMMKLESSCLRLNFAYSKPSWLVVAVETGDPSYRNPGTFVVT
jgi:hypothetical protein